MAAIAVFFLAIFAQGVFIHFSQQRLIRDETYLVSDSIEGYARRTRQDVSAILLLLGFTNALLAAILVALFTG